MSGAQIVTSVTILNSLLGYQGISLTNMTATTEPQIAAGSKVEIAGAYFTFASNDSLNASSWTAATTAATAYIGLTPSGTAGSQIVSGSWTSTAPAWSTSKQGWYATAGSSVRIVAGCYKTDNTTWTDKFILSNTQEEQSRKLKLLTTASVGTNLTVGGTAIITGTASVVSNLTVGGNVAITGTATVTSNIDVAGTAVMRKAVKAIYSTTASTLGYATLYGILSPCIPNIGDSIQVGGGTIGAGSNLYYGWTFAERTGANAIILYGMGYDSGGTETGISSTLTSTSVSNLVNLHVVI